MNFSFNAKSFRSIYHACVDEYVQNAAAGDDENSPKNLALAMERAIDVMERTDADASIDPGLSKSTVNAEDISQIGEYALTLLEGMIGYIESSGGQHNRELMRLSIPVALWIAQHGGQIDKLDLLVNSLADYANELRDPAQLAELSSAFSIITTAVSSSVRQDLEQTNPMRPWRILNLNYGIVATRSHDPQLIEQAYASLVNNLPQEARQFFREGMQQMDIVGYPDEVREVVEKYDRLWGADSTLH